MTMADTTDGLTRFLPDDAMCFPPCPRRKMLMMAGELVFDFKRGGWIDPSTYYVTPVVHYDCFFCGKILPDTAFVLGHLSDEGEE